MESLNEGLSDIKQTIWKSLEDVIGRDNELARKLTSETLLTSFRITADIRKSDG